MIKLMEILFLGQQVLVCMEILLSVPMLGFEINEIAELLSFEYLHFNILGVVEKLPSDFLRYPFFAALVVAATSALPIRNILFSIDDLFRFICLSSCFRIIITDISTQSINCSSIISTFSVRFEWILEIISTKESTNIPKKEYSNNVLTHF